MTASERFIFGAIGVTLASILIAVVMGELLAGMLVTLAYGLNIMRHPAWPSISELESYWTHNPKSQAFAVVLPVFMVGLFAWGFVTEPEGQRIMGKVFRILIWPRTENEKSSTIVRLGRVWHWLAAVVAAAAFSFGCLIAFYESNWMLVILGAALACIGILLIGRAGRYILSNE